MIENCFHVLLRQIKRSRSGGTIRQERKKMLALVATRFASPNGNRFWYLLCSLHMQIKNWEYKAGVLFRRRVVLHVPCLELINDYSYISMILQSVAKIFSSRTNSSIKSELIFFSYKFSSQRIFRQKKIFELFADSMDKIKNTEKSDLICIRLKKYRTSLPDESTYDRIASFRIASRKR